MGMPGIAAVVALAALGGGGGGLSDGQYGQYAEAPAFGAPTLDHRSRSVAGVPGPGRRPELRIAAAVRPDPMVIGGESVYTLTVTNAGGQDAGGVTITGTLDPGTAVGRLPRGCSLAARTVTCGGPDLVIPARRSATYEIPVAVDPSLPDGATVTARARVTSPYAAGHSAQLVSRTAATTDVEIVTSRASALREGAGIAYTLVVTNNGPAEAADVTVQDPLDGDRTTVTGRPAECPGEGPTVICRLGALAPHESRTLSFTAAPDAAGSIDNCATVRTGSREENVANNRSCTSTVVEPVEVRAVAPTGTPGPSPVAGHSPVPAEAPVPAQARRPVPETGHDDGRDDGHDDGHDDGARPQEARPAAAVRGDDGLTEGKGRYEPSPVPAGDGLPAIRERGREALPMTGVSLWLVGLGVPVLLAIGLLVRYFSRRDEPHRLR